MRICSIEDCHRIHYARGWCRRCYMRWRSHGDPTAGGTRDDDERRFWSKVDASGDCWLWTGAPHLGYGRFSRGRSGATYAHRVAYELLVGPIPDGLTLDHLCWNTLCVNPDHLEPVTRAENTRRARLVRAA